MGMSVLRKSSKQLLPIILALFLGLVAIPGKATIVLHSAAVAPVALVPLNRGMRTIVIAPFGLTTSEASYPLQRALAWSVYRRGDPRSGLPLVVSSSVGASMGAVSARQANLRAHLAKANAYRLGFVHK